MARRLLSLVTAIATGAAVAVAVSSEAATAAVSPRAPFSALTTEGAAGSWLLGADLVKEYTGSELTVSADVDSVSFDAVSPAWWDAWVTGPTDGDIVVGTFPTTGSNGPGVIGLHISGDGRGCGNYAGTIVVHEVARDAGTGVITSFAATYSTQCDSTMPANVGELRFNSTIDYERFGTLPLGTTSTPRTVTVTASEDTTFGQASIGGAGSAHFVTTGDTCSGQTVAAGQTCAIGLAAHVRSLAGQAAVLRLPSASGDRVVGLTAVGRETANGAYTALRPARLLDTRRKVGISTTTPIGAGKYVDLQVTGRGGVPSTGPVAVVLNVTVVAPTSAGYVTLYPTGKARPVASSVNFNKGWTGANLVTVTLGTGGKVRIWNYAGSTHVVADVMGYYHGPSSSSASGYGGYGAVTPTRLLDTRTTTTWDGTPLLRNQYVWVIVDFGPLNPHVKAFAVNVTVTKPTGSGHLSAWDGRDDQASSFPKTSTLNFTTGRTVPNMAIVPTSPCGATECVEDPTMPKIGVLNTSGGSAHVIVDLVGFFDDNTGEEMSRFKPLASPTRIVNTKINHGLTGAFGPGSTRKVVAPPSVAGYNTTALVTNTTANRPTSTTVLTLWGGWLPKTPKPKVSNLNPYAGQVVSNMTITDVGATNDFWVNNSSGTTHLVIDIAGSMELYPALAVPSSTGQQDSASDKAAGAPSATAPRIRVEGVMALTPGSR